MSGVFRRISLSRLLAASVVSIFFLVPNVAAQNLKYQGSYTPSAGSIQPFSFVAFSTNVMLRADIVRLDVTPFAITDGTTTWTITDGLLQIGSPGQNDVFVFFTQGYDFDQGDFTNGNGLTFTTFFFHRNGPGTYSTGAGDNAIFRQIVNGNLHSLQSSGAVSMTALAVGCQVKASDVHFSIEDVDPLTQLGRSMQAAFTPSAGLSGAATACGFEKFDWQQTVDVLPCPSSIFAMNLATIGLQNMCPDNSLQAPPKFKDPLPGGYNYLDSQLPPFRGAYPFYYNPADIGNPLSGCAQTDEFGACVMSIVSSPASPVCANCDTTLNFSDNPADHSLLIAALDQSGSFVAFTTSLVGVMTGNLPSPPIVASDTGVPITWSWKSDFDGFSGGVTKLSNNHPVDPGSGSGGITITNVSGVPQTPPTVTCAATPNVLWPPNGKSVIVTVSGKVLLGTQPLAPDATRFAVIDGYGQVQPSGSVKLQAEGAYSFGVSLVSGRDGNDRDGRTYSILVNARDTLGNVGSCSAMVTVPHDQDR